MQSGNLLFLLVFLPSKNINKGRQVINTAIMIRFMFPNTVSEKGMDSGSKFNCEGVVISPIKLLICHSSAALIGADPEIPPCHTIRPLYPAAPING